MTSFSVSWKPGQYERIFRQKPPREVHISDMRNFKDCRQRWHFASMHRLAKVPNYPNRHLWLGRAVHYALAAYYSSNKLPRTGLLEAYDEYVTRSSIEIIIPFISDFPERDLWIGRAIAYKQKESDWHSLYRMLPKFVEQGLPETIAEELPETTELGRGVLEYYVKWAAEADKKLELNVNMPELSFSVPIPSLDNANFAGTVDAVAETRHGVYLLENKTCTQFPDFRGILNDDQAVGYVWAAQRDSRFEGMRPKGVIFTFIRKKLVVQPRVLKSGKLSQDRKQDTTYRLYLDAITERGLDPADYQDILNFLIEKPNNFVRRARIEVFPNQLKHFERGLRSAAKEMLDPEVPIYTEGNWFKCSRCAYRVPCTLVRHGADPMPYLNWEYKTREIEKVGIDEETDT